jgi:hypothetical protein
MSVLGMFMCLLTVFMSRNSMLLSFFVFSLFVMMNSFTVVVCRRLVMPGCIVMVLAGSMFHGHWMCPFENIGANDRRSFIQEDLQENADYSHKRDSSNTPD